MEKNEEQESKQRFFKIPAEIIFETNKGEEEKLLPSAKLLLIYIICLNDSLNFTISLNGLKALYGGHKKQLLAGMKELKRKGILVTEQTKGDGGKWGQTLYKINMEYFNRSTEKGSTEKGSTEKGSTEKGSTLNGSTEKGIHTLDYKTLDYKTLDSKDIRYKENCIKEKTTHTSQTSLKGSTSQSVLSDEVQGEETNTAKDSPPIPPKQEKKAYADYVKMTEKEHATLIKEFGEDFTKRCIDKLNAFKGSKGKIYKSDYLAIRSWVTRAVKEDETVEIKNAFYKEKDTPTYGRSEMCQHDHSNDDDERHRLLTDEEREKINKELFG